MKIKIIAVGKVKDLSVATLIAEYCKRIGYDAKIEILLVKDSNPTEEGRKIADIIERIREPAIIYALSEEGKQLDSMDFAARLKQFTADGKTIIFIIGGPFGLSQDVKEKAGLIISLSKMTFTHEMCQLFLIEQLYRAITINQNKSYHKAG